MQSDGTDGDDELGQDPRHIVPLTVVAGACLDVSPVVNVSVNDDSGACDADTLVPVKQEALRKEKGRKRDGSAVRRPPLATVANGQAKQPGSALDVDVTGAEEPPSPAKKPRCL